MHLPLEIKMDQSDKIPKFARKYNDTHIKSIEMDGWELGRI